MPHLPLGASIAGAAQFRGSAGVAHHRLHPIAQHVRQPPCSSRWQYATTPSKTHWHVHICRHGEGLH